MKKGVLFIIMLLIAITLKAQVEPTDTDGDGYYNISTLDHLRWVSENSSCWDWNFELDNDIDAGDTKNWNDGAGWSPIGNDSVKFTGNFEGHGNAIDSLYINSSHCYYVGFIGYSENNTISNLSLIEIDVNEKDAVSSLCGGLIGLSYQSIVENCNITGNISASSAYYCGGLIARSDGGTIKNCNVAGNISASSAYYCAGLIARNDSEVLNCYAKNTVSAPTSSSAGLIGKNSGNISNCYATGEILPSPISAGLVAENSGYINKCYASGKASSSDYSGGLVGKNSGRLNNCYAIGVAFSYGVCGGLVGHNQGDIIACYSLGAVRLSSKGSPTAACGGLIGINEGSASRCYAKADIVSQPIEYKDSDCGGLVGNNSGDISDCYVTGYASASDPDCGGLVGNNSGNISNCYSAVSMFCLSGSGGFVAKVEKNSTITNCFWNSEIADTESSAAGTPKTTAEMKIQSTFTNAGWDFENIWAIDGVTNDGYPFFGTTTGVLTENILPTTNLTCSPNPCNTSSIIAYSVNNAGFVNIAVYDMLGNEIAILVNNYQVAGEHEVIFNAEELSAGVYFVSINTVGMMETGKIIVAK